MKKIEILLKAISFASRAHNGQIRKDGKTPYSSHPFRVTLILSQVFGVKDERILTAGVLHDVVEDTTTDYDDIEKEFGKEIADWVGMLSKDKRMPEEEREAQYFKTLGEAPDEVKLIKLADTLDNIIDSPNAHSAGQSTKTITRSIQYLDLFRNSINDKTSNAFQIVERRLTEAKKR
jgi:guanosine-3',5'-bis(diphosphate) 3'-pyrophosphohydrolase